jgi:sugar phosphate isomerase/epimerase
MNHSRRNFVKTSAAALVGAAILPGKLFALNQHKVEVGLQLWSVRDDMHADPLGTLKLLAAMGYTVVEHAGYDNRKFYGYTPAEFKKILSDLGLRMYSGHVDFGLRMWDEAKQDFTDGWKKTIEDAASVGQQFMITPELEMPAQQHYDTLLKVIDLWNRCGALCQKSGLEFGYHDDYFEDIVFNDMKLFDIIMKNSDPKRTIHQYDFANLYNAAETDPLAMIEKYPGRFVTLHVKDILKEKNTDNQHDSTILGKGMLKVKEVLPQAIKNGAWLLIIEQEAYQQESPMDCAKDDLAAMRSWGY